jgi:hypothetical protein
MALRSQIVNLVQGDFGNAMDIRLRDRRTREYIDLTGVTAAVLKFRAAGSTTTLFTETLVIDTPLTDGHLILTFTSGNLDIDPGMYEGEIQLTSATREQTPYEVIKFRVREDFT